MPDAENPGQVVRRALSRRRPHLRGATLATSPPDWAAYRDDLVRSTTCPTCARSRWPGTKMRPCASRHHRGNDGCRSDVDQKAHTANPLDASTTQVILLVRVEVSGNRGQGDYAEGADARPWDLLLG